MGERARGPTGCERGRGLGRAREEQEQAVPAPQEGRRAAAGSPSGQGSKRPAKGFRRMGWGHAEAQSAWGCERAGLLTQDTTLPLKQGRRALSSEISSFTTLQGRHKSW